MKLARFTAPGEAQTRFAEVRGGELIELEGGLFDERKPTGRVFALSDVRLGVPLVPERIIGIGLNYVAEGEAKPDTNGEIPPFFFKPNSSLIADGEEIVIPAQLAEVKFESELVAIIGREATDVSEEEALDYVFGYTVGNDITAPQFFSPSNWTLGKLSPTFTPLGPVIETEVNALDVRVSSRVNGVPKQNSSTVQMIRSVPFMISYLSRFLTLLPGDVILTGAPVGAEFFRRGDVIECEVEGIGVLRNPVRV